MRSAWEWGRDHQSCSLALQNRLDFDKQYPGAGQRGWYEFGCLRGDYLFWQLLHGACIIAPHMKKLERVIAKVCQEALDFYKVDQRPYKGLLDMKLTSASIVMYNTVSLVDEEVPVYDYSAKRQNVRLMQAEAIRSVLPKWIGDE